MSKLDLAKSMQLYEEAITLIPGGSQTMSKRPEAFAMGAMPIYIQRGEGCYVWDVDGNKYIDYISALGPITLGYCYPAVDEAVRRQLKDGMIFPMMHPLEVEAAKAIIEMVPCAEMVRFLKTGAEATSAAARIARGYTRKDMVLSSGYHGWLDTWGALNSARGVPAGVGDSVAGFSFGDMTSDNSLGALLEKHKGQVACIMMEAASYSTMDTGDYLRYARELADKHEAVLAYDEIVTGFRLAKGGAQEYFDVIPDLACFAKGISNGMPVAAVVGKREVMKTAAELVISSTYGGDAISLAACVACLKELRDNDVIGHIWEQGGRLIDGMNAIAHEIGLSLEFKGYPVMASFCFRYDDAGVNADLTTLLLQEMAKRGILLRRGGLIFMTYSHGAEHVDATLDICREVFPLLLEAYNSGNINGQLVTHEVAASIRRF
jgi:glutamate-1-semialdehyde 2,1-aminomutase